MHAPNAGLDARDQIARMTQAAFECREAAHAYQARSCSKKVNSNTREISDDGCHAESRLDPQATEK
jgi:hypothetical protein